MRLTTLFLLLLLAGVAGVIAVANRQTVVFSLDPFSTTFPAIAFAMPLYLLVFLTLLIGVLLGGATVALGRMRRRRSPAPLPVDEQALGPLEREGARVDSPPA